MSEEQKGAWALLIANHGRTYLVFIDASEVLSWNPSNPSHKCAPPTDKPIRTADVLEIWSSLMPAPDGNLAKGTFNTMFEQCGHAAPVTFFAPSAFVWVDDLHEDDRKMYEEYVAQNEKDRLSIRARRMGIEMAGEKKKPGAR